MSVARRASGELAACNLCPCCPLDLARVIDCTPCYCWRGYRPDMAGCRTNADRCGPSDALEEVAVCGRF
jgi:hypothetical protein